MRVAQVLDNQRVANFSKNLDRPTSIGYISRVKLTCAQIIALRPTLSFEQATVHPAHCYTKRLEHMNANGIIDVEQAVFFYASNSPTGRLWVMSRHSQIVPDYVKQRLGMA